MSVQTEETEQAKPTRRQRVKRIWREWVKPILIVVLVLTTFRSAVADWNDVPTGSMKPTILEGDRILVNKLAYDLKVPFTTWHIAEWGGPDRGDVVVCFSPADESRLVKRVIGVPGDVIELRQNQLWVNGQPVQYDRLDEDTISQIDAAGRDHFVFAREKLGDSDHPLMLNPRVPAIRSFGPTEIPEGRYFLMGDNRDDSKDSRWFGFVERDRIVGRAFRIAFSLDYENYYLPRWDRLLRSLP